MKKDKLIEIYKNAIIHFEEGLKKTDSSYMEDYFNCKIECYKNFIFDLEYLDE